MQSATPGKIRPVKLLYDIRKAVSEILNRPFTERIDHQVFKPDQKILALWAADCAGHVLPYFEEKFPGDDRPRKAIETLRVWMGNGLFKMTIIRQASLDSHASARNALKNGETAASFAAHAAGQAVATAHVSTHALGCGVYGIRAAAAHSDDGHDLIQEQNWQLQRLRLLVKQNSYFMAE